MPAAIEMRLEDLLSHLETIPQEEVSLSLLFPNASPDMKKKIEYVIKRFRIPLDKMYTDGKDIIIERFPLEYLRYLLKLVGGDAFGILVRISNKECGVIQYFPNTKNCWVYDETIRAIQSKECDSCKIREICLARQLGLKMIKQQNRTPSNYLEKIVDLENYSQSLEKASLLAKALALMLRKKPFSDIRILDIGSYDGLYFRSFSPEIRFVTVCSDISPPSKEKLPTVGDYVVLDGKELPFRDKAFDIVCVFSVPKIYEGILDEAIRVSRELIVIYSPLPKKLLVNCKTCGYSGEIDYFEYLPTFVCPKCGRYLEGKDIQIKETLLEWLARRKDVKILQYLVSKHIADGTPGFLKFCGLIIKKIQNE